MVKKAERGAKAALIRQGLQNHPDLKPSLLADELNKDLPPGVKPVKATEVSNYRNVMKTQVRKGRAARKAVAPAVAAPAANGSIIVQTLTHAKALVELLGKDEAQKVIAML